MLRSAAMDHQPSTAPLQAVENVQPLSLSLPKGPWTKQLKGLYRSFAESSILQHERALSASKHCVAGYRMFKAEKVHDALLCEAGGQVYLKATVEASFSVSKRYKVAAAITSDGLVRKGCCDCRAGASGVCKHVAALLWFVLDMKRSGQAYIQDTASCTGKPRAWATGTKHGNMRTLKFSDLNFVKHVPNKAKQRKRAKENARVQLTEGDTQGLHKTLCEEDMHPMLRDTLRNNSFLPVPLPVIQQDAVPPKLMLRLPTKVLWSENVPTGYNFEDCSLTLEEAWALEESTRDQGSSATWSFERAKRLTTSHFGDIVSRQKPADEKFLKRVFGSSTLQTNYMRDGLLNEESAVRRYVENGASIEVYHCGLCVNPGVAVLGATPDRVVKDGDSFGLLEVKTLSAARDRGELLCNAIQTASYLKDGLLRTSHKYYYQVQGQMALTGLSWCDFLVDNGVECTVQRIQFDSLLWTNKMMPRLLQFYRDYKQRQVLSD
ncbi:uncharacterized protein [Dermacentor andersoni]|uniref:uncharacterized protein n=1 Tax=Dermacentor andersoni TaxID=34620 RepID=UPI003B3AC40C